MGFWTSLFGIEETKAAPASDYVREQILGAMSGRKAVTHDTALQVSAVLCCARVIAEGLAQIPCKVYAPGDNGGRREAHDHPLYALLHRRPNGWQTSFEFREQIGLHLALTGNAFVYISRDRRGRPIELLPYEPGSVTVGRNTDLSLTYKIKLASGGAIDVPTENMWHLRGPSWNGYLGLDAVKLARDAIGLSIATEDFGSKLFENGARPGGILSTDQVLTDEQAKALRDGWNASQSGVGNAHKTALLYAGLKFQPLGTNPNDAQFLETRKYQVEEICRAFRVLPIMVMQSGSTSYASVEQMLLAHLTHTLSPWHERFEQSAINALLTPAEVAAGYTIKLISRGLLRGSSAERATFYASMIGTGIMTQNEAREAEDMEPSSDPAADRLRPAANIFGSTPNPSTEVPK